MKDEQTVKSYEQHNEEKWNKINKQKRADISFGQAINLAEQVVGRSYDQSKHTIEDHLNRTFSVVPLIYNKIMKAYEEVVEDAK